MAHVRDDAITRNEETKRELAKAKADLSFIQTDRGFEEYVRTTYPVVKQGEGVVIVYDEPGSPVTAVREGMTIWEKLLVFLRPFLPTPTKQ